MVNANLAKVTDHKTGKSSQMVCSELEVYVVATAFSNVQKPFTIENNTVIYCIICLVSSIIFQLLLKLKHIFRELTQLEINHCMGKRLIDTWALSHN